MTDSDNTSLGPPTDESQLTEQAADAAVDPSTVTVRGKAHGTISLFGGPPREESDR